MIIMVLIPVMGVGCARPSVSGTVANELAATMVPDINLDVYLYVNQEGPTIVPRNFIGASTDISVDSLSIWGIIRDNAYAVGGALTFTNASDASYIYSQLPQQNDLWKKLSSNIIYFVQGSDGPAESLISAISNNNFKQYDNNQALGEVSLMPDGNTAIPAAIGIIKPTQAALNLLKPYIDANSAKTIDSIYTWAKPQVIVIGLYSSQQIDVADIIQRINTNTVWNADLGVLVSINSSFPGLAFSPVASKYMDNTGYPKANLGNLTVYKAFLDGGNGKTIPVLVNVSGNHVFATASGKESYADTLMTSITR
jgi:hypothetical protein